MKLLVVDDEKAMANAIRDNLAFEGFQVDVAYGGRSALDTLLSEKYALVILDIMMPDIDGFEVLSSLRNNKDQTPVIFLTARSAEADKLRGLGLGADDYVVKPFSILELIARVKAVLGRTAPGGEFQTLEIGNTTIDFTTLTATIGQEEKELSRYEADILRVLMANPGRIFSRDDILNAVWGINAFPSNRTIDNYIVKLRQKIETDPKNPQYLISVYGMGYKFVG
ncbi:response regulator transcription factor [Pontiellaceae bacterium B1224]|nr:response regulator transcription factor [Pontiellaceae bacterium B1224]